MKKLSFILFIIFISFFASAQKDIVLHYQEIDNKEIHFGFTLGFNVMDFSVDPSNETWRNDTLMPELNNLAPGFHVAIISNIRLNDNFDFRFLPGISLGQRNLLFYKGGVLISEMKIESTFIDIPFQLKYKADRINNFRPYLIGGFNLRNDMARNKDFNEDEDIYIKLKPFDVYYELGFGIDFYLPYFKFSTELKYSVGTLDVLSHVPHETEAQFVNSIDKLNSSLFMISFHFE
ncbi:MAG: porin family protein [Bacteroidota bacterium]|nr:porin family protein [Bacteroidota bacterium]